MNRFRNPNFLLRMGLLFLVLANVWNWLNHRNVFVTEDLGDRIFGLLMGIAIGFLLVSIGRGRGRWRSCSEA